MTDFATLHKAFEDAGHELFEVGGCVRDRLLGVEPNDIDFATGCLPDRTVEILLAAGFKSIPIGIEFGTIQTLVGKEKVEITTFRCAESYTKGSRKPGVVFGKTIESDLARRDFTFNAIAMDRLGNTIDPFNGEADLRDGVIRTPIEPGVSFTDDPLRMLRACRFMARGMGAIGDTTLEAMCKLSHLVHELSTERVFEEMTKLLMADTPSQGLNLMRDTGLLKELFPELQVVADFPNDPGKYHHLPVWDHVLLVVDSGEKIPEVMWSCLFHDVAKPQCWSKSGGAHGNVHFYKHDKEGAEVWGSVADRLKVSNEFKRNIHRLIYEHQNLRGEMGDKGIRRLIHRLGDQLENQFHLARADIIGHKPRLTASSLADLEGLKRRIDNIDQTAPVTDKLPRGTGDVIMLALGLKPCAELGEIMKGLSKLMVDGELKTEKDDIVTAARNIQKGL